MGDACSITVDSYLKGCLDYKQSYVADAKSFAKQEMEKNQDCNGEDPAVTKKSQCKRAYYNAEIKSLEKAKNAVLEEANMQDPAYQTAKSEYDVAFNENKVKADDYVSDTLRGYSYYDRNADKFTNWCDFDAGNVKDKVERANAERFVAACKKKLNELMKGIKAPKQRSMAELEKLVKPWNVELSVDKSAICLDSDTDTEFQSYTLTDLNLADSVHADQNYTMDQLCKARHFNSVKMVYQEVEAALKEARKQLGKVSGGSGEGNKGQGGDGSLYNDSRWR